jgi:protein-S-isoprenylcysteine O-methyltransferase Ste14
LNAESIFRAAFWVLVGAIVAMRMYFALRVRRSGEQFLPDREAIGREGPGKVFTRAILFSFLLATLGLYALSAPFRQELSMPLPIWLRFTGCALGLVSLALWIRVQAALGTEWSPQLQLRKNHRLVTSGPYTRVRHPMYAAMFGIAVALALISANWCFGLLAVVGSAVIFLRVPAEEHMMLGSFGEDYRGYMRRTGRFFPRLRRCESGAPGSRLPALKQMQGSLDSQVAAQTTALRTSAKRMLNLFRLVHDSKKTEASK